MRIFLSLLMLVATGFIQAETPTLPIQNAYEVRNMVLYYSPNCPFSQQVLNYLQIVHKKVPMRNVLTDPEAKSQLRNFGRMEVPCLNIQDQTPIYGAEPIIKWISKHLNELESE
jgi:glutaredoxin